MTAEFPKILVRCPACREGFYITATTQVLPRVVGSGKAVVRVSVSDFEHDCGATV